MSDQEFARDSLEELEDVSDDCSDYEDSLKTTKRRKLPVAAPKPPKRPRRKSASKVTSSPHEVSTRPAGGVNKRHEGIRAEDIYKAVLLGKSAMVAVVDEWLDSYKQNQETGLLSLINFIVLSCGCKGVVSRQMLSTMQHAEIISSLTKEFEEDSVNYPLTTPGPQSKRFKSGLCEFAQVLVHSCRNSFLFDEYLFHSLLALLTGLSDSQVRAFRHTSSLLAMKLMTGLVPVSVTLSVQLQTTQQRWDRENCKSSDKRNVARLEELQPIIYELREKQEELNSMMNATFKGVFVHRYRDHIPDIRMVCMEELGMWLKTNPEYFLNDGCLKYLGWTLHDKQSPVRLQCVRALQGLYQEEAFIGRLELFTSRFKERILSMVLDKDPDVALEVVNLLLLIQQKTEEYLTDAESRHLYPVVYSSHRGLSSAAGTFLYNKLKTLTSGNREEGTDFTAAFFQLLSAFHMQSEFHEHAAYLVDSLWDVAGSELRDWETMTTILLEDVDLTDEEEGTLIEIMVCAIRQAAQTTPPVGRSQGKKSLTAKEKKSQEQDKRRITTHFIPLLPQLLSKYSADAEKVGRLLKIPLHFNLEMYNSAQWLEKHLDLLLSQICDIVQKHTEESVLKACASLASALSSDTYKFSSRSRLAFGLLSDGLTECFRAYLNNLQQGPVDDDDTYRAAVALKRIAAFSGAIDPTGWKLFDPCVQLLKGRISDGELDKELMVPALRCAFFHLMWAKVNAVNFQPTQADLNHLRKMVRSFCRVCQACLSVDQAEIRNQAFELLCDQLLLYSTSSVSSHPALHSLAHLPSDSLRSEMAAFLLDYIFTEPEVDANTNEEEEETMMISVLRKRNQLAGYCKLIIYGVLDLSAATDVFKQYKKYFRDFGDIIKTLMTKSKLISPVQSAKTVCLSLQQLFTEMLTEGHSMRDLGEIRDLGKRLAMSFGIDPQRVRKPLVALHMDGIRFALRKPQDGENQLPNVSFLEILSEFTFKLLPQDKSQMAALLRAECPSAAISWPSVRMYLQSLTGRITVQRPREQQEEGEDAVSPRRPPSAKRKRKKTTAQRPVCASAGGPWLDSSSSIHGNLPTPTLTSTVQRQPPKRPASGKSAASVSDNNLGLPELESEDEFSGPQMRKVKPVKRRQLHSTMTFSDSEQQDLNSNLTLLSLIEDADEEMEEAEVEINESDIEDDTGYVLPSTRQNSTSILDELFD